MTIGMRVTLIGLGHMGGPMGSRLAEAGFDLTVFDLDPARAAPALKHGARLAPTAADAARRADILVTMLPTPAAVEEVMLGAGGVLEALSDGALWIDMSTSSPAVSERVRRRADGRIGTVDAPVAGMSSGAVAEVLTIGARSGVDLGVLHTALVEGPTSSRLLARDLLPLLRDGEYEEGFSMALATKDLRLAMDLARSAGVPAELSGVVEQVFARARAVFGDDAGEMTPVRLYEEAAGVLLRLPDAVRPSAVTPAASGPDAAAAPGRTAAGAASDEATPSGEQDARKVELA